MGKVNKAREDGEKGRGGKFGGGKFGRKRASGQSESEVGGEEWRNESNESGRDKARGYLSWKGGKTAGCPPPPPRPESRRINEEQK